MGVMTILRRDLETGKSVSFDDGRVVITLEEKSGRRARLKIEIAPAVQIDKPSMAAGGIFPQKTVAKQKVTN